MERETKAPLTREAVEGIRRGCCQPVYRPEELIDQLAQSHELLRARLDAAEQEKADLLRMNAELHEERQYLVSLRTRLDAAERQLEAFREYKAGVEAAVAEHVASAKE